MIKKITFCILAMLVSAPAFCQFGEYMTPPQKHEVIDSFGINMASGLEVVNGMELSIGDGGSGVSVKTGGQRFAYDNYSATITQLTIKQMSSEPAEVYGLPVGVYKKVDALGFSEVFQETSGSYTNVKKQGGNLSCTQSECTYLSKYGDTVTFDLGKVNGTLSVYPKGLMGTTATVYDRDLTLAANYVISENFALATKAKKANGEELTYYYVNFSGIPSFLPLHNFKSAVVSSLGWMIKYYFSPSVLTSSCNDAACDYVGEAYRTLTLLNTSVEYCDPVSENCSNLSKSWPASRTDAKSTRRYSTMTQAYIPLDAYAVQQGNYTDQGTWTTSSITNPLGKKDGYSNYVGVMGSVDSYTYPSGVTKSFTKLGMAYFNGSFSPTTVSGKVRQLKIGTKTLDYLFDQNKGPDGAYYFDGPAKRLTGYADLKNRKTIYKYSDVYGETMSDVINPDATPTQANPTGGYTHYDYDDRGNITYIKRYPKNGGSPLVTSATYPAVSTCATQPKICNKPSTITDENGVVTTFEYYAEHGGIKSITKPAVNGVQAKTWYSYAQKTPYTKNSAGSLVAGPTVWRLVSESKCMTQTLKTCEGTADELRTEYSDFNNNLQAGSITIKAGDGSINLLTKRTYDDYGNVKTEEEPRGGSANTKYYFYDLMQHKIGEIGIDPDGSGSLPRQAIQYGYNDDGKPNLVIKGTTTGTDWSSVVGMTANQRQETEYSPDFGLPISEKTYSFHSGIAKLESVIQKNYDDKLRVQCVAHRLSLSTALDACSPGIATETYGGTSVTVNDRITKYAYDETGAVTSVISAYGTPKARVDKASSYYDSNGLLNTETDANGSVTTYEYDNFNRSTKTIYPDPATGAANASDYTEKGYTGNFVSSTRLRDGQIIGFTPDELYRVKAKTGAVSETFGYDNFNQIVSHTNNSTGGASATSSYVRNSLGWLKSETNSFGTVSYDHDSYGRRIGLTWPDGFSVKYSHKKNNIDTAYLQKITESDETKEIASFDYYDSGKRKSLTRGNGVVTTYGYDDLDRLDNQSTNVGGVATTDDIAENFGYSLAGQLKSYQLSIENQGYLFVKSQPQEITYTPDKLNRIASVDGFSFNYDSRGNLTQDNTGSVYTYNANNLMLTATKNGVATLTYDAENRLYSVSKASTTRFMYDGADLIAEVDANNNILRRYVHGPETDDPILWLEGSGTADKRYYTYDRQGSILGITKQDGTSLSVNAYDEYGIQKDSSSVGRFQYTGQTWLPEIGLYYYKARLYSPSLGRFMQTDPVGYKDGINWYAYVGDDPVNKTDSSGLCPSCVGALSSVVLGAAIRAVSGGDILDWKAMAVDAAAGAVGAGLVNKLGKVIQLSKIPASGIGKSRAIGEIGEKAAGITARKEGVRIGGRLRFPDEVTSSTVREVKNVAAISSRDAAQIADSVTLAQATGKTAILEARVGADVSKVQGLIDSGELTLKNIPGIGADGLKELSNAASATIGAMAASTTDCAKRQLMCKQEVSICFEKN